MKTIQLTIAITGVALFIFAIGFVIYLQSINGIYMTF